MPSIRRRLSRQEKQAQTRVRLLRSAELVFAERGFFAASLDEIAARAGFSIGAVYSNFESKGDLFLALFEEHVADQVDDYLELFAAGETVGLFFKNYSGATSVLRSAVFGRTAGRVAAEGPSNRQ